MSKIFLRSVALIANAFIFAVAVAAVVDAEESAEFVITVPGLSANTTGGAFQVTSPPLTVIKAAGRFQITAPSLTANTQGVRVEVTTEVLSAFVSARETSLPQGLGQRVCIGLYSCYNKFDIRNAIKEVSQYTSMGEASFCSDVKSWFGRAECESTESRNATNNQVGFPYSKELINCLPLDRYIADLRSRFAAGQETQIDEERLAAAFQETQMLLFSGREDAFCKAIMNKFAGG